MSIELSKETHAQAIASIDRCFEVERDECIGNTAAGARLGFFLGEVGPTIYNKAVAAVQERLLERVQELDIEIHEDGFEVLALVRPGQSCQVTQAIRVGNLCAAVDV